MDPKPSSSGGFLALAHGGSSMSLRLPSAGERPSIEQHVVRPEARGELVRGRQVQAMPAAPPHADRHFRLDYVIGAHIRAGYVGSTELLTRAAENSDFATDTCVRREGIDPKTDARYLEELAFEVVNEQSERDVTEKAEELTARGVRRVVAIFVKKGEAREWSAAKGAWETLDPESAFIDATLSRPLRVRDLLDAASADNAVALALLEKNNPVLVQRIEEGEQRGEARGLAEGRKQGLKAQIQLACELLGIELTAERQAQIGALDGEGLEAWLTHLRQERRLP